MHSASHIKNMTMSNKSKLYRKAKEAKQEKQARSVIKWIVISFVVLALILMAWAMYIFA